MRITIEVNRPMIIRWLKAAEHCGTISIAQIDRLMKDATFKKLLGGEIVQLWHDMNEESIMPDDKIIKHLYKKHNITIG